MYLNDTMFKDLSLEDMEESLSVFLKIREEERLEEHFNRCVYSDPYRYIIETFESIKKIEQIEKAFDKKLEPLGYSFQFRDDLFRIWNFKKSDSKNNFYYHTYFDAFLAVQETTMTDEDIKLVLQTIGLSEEINDESK